MALQKHNSPLVEAAYKLLLEKKKPIKLGQLYELLQANDTPELTNYHTLISALHGHIKYWKDFAVIKRVGRGYFTINENNSSTLRKTKTEIEEIEAKKIRRIRSIHLNVLSKILEDFPELRNGIDELHWSIFTDIYLHDLSFAQVACRNDLSRERVRQINKNVLNLINKRAKRAFHELRHFSSIVSELRSQNAALRKTIYTLTQQQISSEDEKPPVDILIESVEQLVVPIRVQNVLKTLGIKTVGDLITTSKKKLLQTPNFGFKCMLELETAIEMIDLKWEVE